MIALYSLPLIVFLLITRGLSIKTLPAFNMCRCLAVGVHVCSLLNLQWSTSPYNSEHDTVN